MIAVPAQTRAAFTIAAAAMAVASVSTQTPAPLPTPQFGARAELVLVDVTVVDDDGRQVVDLTAEDFALEVAGRPRPIRSVQYVSATPPPATPGSRARQASSTSNADTGTGRLVLIAVDETYLRFGANRAILQAAETLLERLGPGDLVGLARLPGMTDGVEFTLDRALVQAALRGVTGRMPPRPTRPAISLGEAQTLDGPGGNWPAVVSRECANERGPAYDACVSMVEGVARDIIVDFESRTATTVRALEGLFTRMRPLNRPVSVVLISEGLFVGREGTGQIERLAARAADARASLYVVRPARELYDLQANRDMTIAIEDDHLRRQGLEQLAASARGALFTAVGDGAGVFDRISGELAGYYLLGFEPTEEDRQETRAIAVKVARRGVTVRARRSFTLSAPPARLLPLTPAEQLQQTLRAALPASGVPIRVATYRVTSNEGANARVLVGAEIGEPATDAATLPVGLVVVDNAGKVVASNLAEMELQPAQSAHPSPRLFLTTVLLPPGDYTLRLAAVGKDGLVGSVHHPFSARLQPVPGGFGFSDVIVSTLSGGEPRPSPSAVVDGDRMIVMLEGEHPDAKALESVRVTFDVGDEARPNVIASLEAQSESRANGTRRAFASMLALDRLQAGEYVVRARIEAPGRPRTTIERAFRFERPAAPRTAGESGPAAAPVPGTVAVPRPGVAGVTIPVPRFAVRDVLRPEVVNRFLDRLQTDFPPSAAARPFVERARAGAFTPASVAMAGGSDDVLLLFIGGLAALEQGQVPQATTLFQRTLRAAPDFIGVAFYMAAAHAAAGRDREAANAWQMSLLSPEAEPAYPLMVDALLRAGEAQRALDTIDRAPESWKASRERIEREVLAEAVAGRDAEALPKIQRLVAERPDDLGLLFLGIQLLYRSHLSTPLTGADLARFGEWAARYEQAAGAERAQVSAWRAAVQP